ncbi:Hypothetical predicted protein, partial [Olea europaea subsp. europaea]
MRSMMQQEVSAIFGTVYECQSLHLSYVLHFIYASAMLFIERVMAIVITFVHFLGKKRYTKYQLDSIKEDLDKNKNYPTVLVQIPMFNEKEVYKLSIGAVCGPLWPSDRLIVQVLDDFTDEALRKGLNVKYETRNNRNGYKAGALRDGLKKYYVEDCDFVVIFDADFQPKEDFLWRTIPYLIENPELGLVKARWKFGTAGVWRVRAIDDAGGWKDRTTVEDMDLAVRAGLKGWKFLFVGDLQVKNELPSTFEVYRYQQHRWSCGPANLFRKTFIEFITYERVSLFKKWHVIYAFFFVRKIIAHWIFTSSRLLDIIRECYVTAWIQSSYYRGAEANRVNEWIVTEKLGNMMKQKFSARAAR